MAKELNDPKTAKTKVFEVEGVGEFMVRRPTFNDVAEIGKRYTQYTGGVLLTDYEATSATKVRAILEVIAISKPDGFDFATCDDIDPFFAWYKEYTDWLDSFRPKRASTTDDGTAGAFSDTAGT